MAFFYYCYKILDGNEDGKDGGEIPFCINVDEGSSAISTKLVNLIDIIQ